MTPTMTSPTTPKSVMPPAVPATPKQPTGSDASPLGGIVRYLKDVFAEGKKVSWPTGPQIVSQTIIVLFTVAIATLGLWGIDSLFRFVITLITPHH